MERCGPQNPADRARKYVAQMPSAVSGKGGHDATFAVAMTLIHGFALSEIDAWPILLEYNARCQPCWSERELRHKLSEAGKLSRPSKPRGHLLGGEEPLKKHSQVPPKAERAIWHVKIKPLPNEAPQPEQAPASEPEPAVLEATRIRGESDIFAASVASDDLEAHRIARELLKLHRDGAIKGADDSDARLFAAIIHTFGATYNGIQ